MQGSSKWLGAMLYLASRLKCIELNWQMPTSTVPLAGIMAGFIAGSIGIVLVQGGIGVYPAFVGLIVSMYMPAVEGGGAIQPDALAMGWLLWAAQTNMLIVLGGLSLLLAARDRTPETT